MINENVSTELARELSSYKSSLHGMLLLRYTTLYKVYLNCAKRIGTCKSYVESCEHAKQVLTQNLELYKNNSYFSDLAYKDYVLNTELYAKRAVRDLYAIELGYDKSKSQYDKQNREILHSDEYSLSFAFHKSEKEVISYIKRKVNSYVTKQFAKIESTFLKHIKDNVKLITLLSYQDGCKGFEGSFKIDYEDGTTETVKLYTVSACGPVQTFHYRYILTVTSKRK